MDDIPCHCRNFLGFPAIRDEGRRALHAIGSRIPCQKATVGRLDSDDLTFWEERYHANRTPWELPGVPPAFALVDNQPIPASESPQMLADAKRWQVWRRT